MSRITVGIVFALDGEFEEFQNITSFKEEINILNYTFYKASYINCDVVCVKCGIGKVNAGCVTTLLIEHFLPNIILNSGVAGGINRKLKQLDTVVSPSAVYLDVDMTTDESTDFKYGQLQGFPRVFNLDKEITEVLYKLLPEVYFMTIGTGDTFQTDYKKVKGICDTYFSDLDIGVCDMESASICQIGFIHRIPVIIIRSISDIVGNNGDYTNFVKRASLASAKVVEIILKNITLLPLDR